MNVAWQPDAMDFFQDRYLAEIKPLVYYKSGKISLLDSLMVIVRFIGMLLKVAWALLWQENAYGSHVKPIVINP